MGLPVYEPRRWLAVDAPLKNGPAARSPEALRSVVAQFDVAHNPRYARSVGATWCNRFVSDVTDALRCGVPHWIEVSRVHPDGRIDTSHAGDPAELPDPSAAFDPAAPRVNRVELTANGMIAWLNDHGPRFGWGQIDHSAAGAFAARGLPVVPAWANLDAHGKSVGPGHVAICLPPVGPSLRIAQAGARNFYDEPLEAGFGRLVVLFYAHP
jgi:hypothetical protein